MTTAFTCPECEAPIVLDTEAQTEQTIHPGYHVRGQALEVVLRPCTVAFCTGCEFAVEVRA